MKYKRFKHEFKIDRENKTVSFGGKGFQEPRMLTTADVMAAYGFRRKASKAEFQEFNSKYGITAVKLRKKLNATVREMWINPIDKEVKRYGFSFGGKVSARIVRGVWRNLPKIQEVQEDGLDNLEPFAAILGKSPKEMKELAGKSLWKRLCRNTRTRNTHIAKCLRYNYMVDKKETLETLDKIPSTLLKKGGKSPIPFTKVGIWQLNQFHSISAVLREDWSKLLRMRIICNDTRTMANQLGTTFSYDWSWEKMQQKHDEYTARVYEQQFSKEPFPYVGVTKVDNVEYEEYTATLIKSAYDLAQEGREMHHCVGSYHEYCTKGAYYVYSITKNDEKYSTLAFWYDTRAGFTFSQHYKACNRDVDCDKALKLAEIVHDRLLSEWHERKSEDKDIIEN